MGWFIRSLLFERVFMRKNEKEYIECAQKGNFSEENIENQIIFARKNFAVANNHIQGLIMDSAWVAGIFGPKEIVHMTTSQFPNQLFLCTADGKAYDVTVIAPTEVRPTIQAARKQFELTTIPSFNEDLVEHIAVLYSEADVATVRTSGVFDYYVLVTKGMKEATMHEI